MTSPRLTACFLVALASLGSAQDPGPEKPRRRHRPDPERERTENLVKLPDDFVLFARVPDEGIRPRLAVGKDELALLYFKGDGMRGDLYLAHSSDEAKSFGTSRRLNPTSGTVAARDGAHTGSVDVGPDGRVHVAWISSEEQPALRYVRGVPGSEPEQPLDLGAPPGLCSTTALTVDAEGRLYLFYAAFGETSDLGGTPGRRIWLRCSSDGTTFTEPLAIDREGHDVSEDSAMAAHVDEVMGTVFLLYRTASALKPDNPSLARGMRLLSSKSEGLDFTSEWVDNWKSQRDPRSSAGLTQDKDTTLATWDSGGHVYWAPIRRNLRKVSLPTQPKDEEHASWRTHASGAAGGNEIILTWLELPADDRESPPKVGWRVWFRDGRVPLGGGYAPDPVRAGAPVVFPRKAGGFTILY